MQTVKIACPHCGSDDTLGPFEMDGYRDGKYHVKGLWWTFCRKCARHARAEAQSTRPVRQRWYDDDRTNY